MNDETNKEILEEKQELLRRQRKATEDVYKKHGRLLVDTTLEHEGKASFALSMQQKPDSEQSTLSARKHTEDVCKKHGIKFVDTTLEHEGKVTFTLSMRPKPDSDQPDQSPAKPK